MATRRKAIVISASEDASLRQQYTQFRIPTDQFKKRPAELGLFTDTWNYSTGRSDSAQELIHYMIVQRKQKHKNWPTFNGNHLRGPSVDGLVTQDEEGKLRQIYARLVLPLDVGTEELAYDDQLAANLSIEFSKAVGRVIPGMLLVAYIEAKRKRGQWLTLRDDRDEHRGFDDFDAIEGSAG